MEKGYCCAPELLEPQDILQVSSTPEAKILRERHENGNGHRKE
jgi:hypothetical protein